MADDPKWEVDLARKLGEMRGYVAAYVEAKEDREYRLRRIDECLEILGPPGISRDVQEGVRRAMEGLE